MLGSFYDCDLRMFVKLYITFLFETKYFYDEVNCCKPSPSIKYSMYKTTLEIDKLY